MEASGGGTRLKDPLDGLDRAIRRGQTNPNAKHGGRNVVELIAALDRRPTKRDLDEARRTVAAVAPRIAKLQAALRYPVWAEPWMADRVVPRVTASTWFPQLAGLKELVRVLTLRSHLRLQEGKPDEAVADLILARQVGARLAQGSVGLITHLTAIAMEGIADASILKLAARPELTDRHRARLQRLVEERVAFTRLDPVLRREFDGAVVQMAASLDDPTRDPDLLAKVPAKLRPMFRATPLLLRADTVRAAAPYYMATKDLLRGPYVPNRRFSRLPRLLPPDAPDWGAYILPNASPSEKQFEAFLAYANKHPNLFGRSVVEGSLPVLISLETAERQRVARARMTLIALASLRASRRNGALPPSVDSLVRQRLLASAPIDPFSGKPLRYDAARRLVWSVGKDAKDGGGRDKRADLVMAIL
jgi:hypothetical protein